MYFNKSGNANFEKNAQNIDLDANEKKNKTNENSFLSKFKGMFQNNMSQYRYLINKWVKGDETKMPQHKRSLSMSTVQTYQNEEPYYRCHNGEHSKQVFANEYLNQVSIDGGHSSEEPSMQALCDRKIKLIRQLIELRQLTGYLYRSRSIQGHVLTAVTMTTPTWCDHCGLSVGDQSCLQCSFCSITCHAKCSPYLAFQCTSSATHNNELNESHDLHVAQRTNSSIDLSFNKSHQPIKSHQKSSHVNYNMSEYNLNKININIDNYKINKRNEDSSRGNGGSVSYNVHNGNRCRRSLSAGHRELTMYNDDCYDDYNDDDEDSDYDDWYVNNDEDEYYDEEGDDGYDVRNDEYYEDDDDHKNNDEDDDEKEEEEEDDIEDESDDNDEYNYDEGDDYEEMSSYEHKARRNKDPHAYSRKEVKKRGRFIPQLPPPPTLFPIPSLHQQSQIHHNGCFRNKNNNNTYQYPNQHSGSTKRLNSNNHFQHNPHRSRRLDHESNIQISHNSIHMQHHQHVHHHHHYHHHRSADSTAHNENSSNAVLSTCNELMNKEVDINSISSNYIRNISTNSDSGIFSYDSSSPKINIDDKKSATIKNDIDNNDLIRRKVSDITSNDTKSIKTAIIFSSDDNNVNNNKKKENIHNNDDNNNSNNDNNRKSIYERLNWEFEEKVKNFNNNNKLGLVFNLTSTSLEGSIRVHMNLLQPIKMLLSAPPILAADQSKTSNDTSNKNDTDPIKYDSKSDASVSDSFLTSKSDNTEIKRLDQQKEHSTNNDQIEESIFSSPTHKYHKICTQREVRSFKLPSGTSKLIYINDTTTTEQVIGLLLNKFCIVNNPRHFSLYQQTSIHGGVCTLRKLQNNELPLLLCLHWFQLGEEHLDNNKLILQEKDPGGIAWEHFQLTELNNFLKMLNKEEEERMDLTRNKYRVLKLHIKRRQREITNQTNSFNNLTDVMDRTCIKMGGNDEDIGNKTS